jgi:hypothetical protein
MIVYTCYCPLLPNISAVMHCCISLSLLKFPKFPNHSWNFPISDSYFQLFSGLWKTVKILKISKHISTYGSSTETASLSASNEKHECPLPMRVVAHLVVTHIQSLNDQGGFLPKEGMRIEHSVGYSGPALSEALVGLMLLWFLVNFFNWIEYIKYIFRVLLHCGYWSRDNTVSIVTGYGLDDQGVGVWVLLGARIFTSPSRPGQLWGPPSLLSNE